MEPKYFSATDVVTVSYKTTCSVKVSRYLPQMTAELLMLLNHWNKQFDNCFTIKFYHQVLCLENCFIKISLALLKVSEQFTIDLFFFLLFWGNKGLSGISLLFFIGAWEAFVKTFQQSVFFLSFSNPISVQISQQTQIPYFELCDVFCVFCVQIKLSLCPVLSPCLSKAVEGLRRSSLWNTAKHWIRIQIRTTYWSDLMRKIWFVLFRLSRQKWKKRKEKEKLHKSLSLGHFCLQFERKLTVARTLLAVAARWANGRASGFTEATGTQREGV